MKQISLASTRFELVTKRTRKRVFLDEMSLVVPWRELVGLIQPFAPTGAGAKGGRPSFALETMLRIHFLQQWFGLSDPAMEEALHDTPLYCEFAHLDAGMARLHGEETVVFADAGYQGATKRAESTGVQWHVAMRPGKRRALDKQTPWGKLLDKAEQLKASVRAKVEHPFRVIKCQFGYTKVRYKGLAKNTAQLVTLFALGNLWMARRRILQGAQG